MARIGNKFLDAGDVFPPLEFQLLGGGSVVVPNGLPDLWNIVLFYRGSWCPFCVAQLKSFQGGLEQLNDEGVGVIAASVDPVDSAEAMKLASGAAFPIAYGLDVQATALATGAYFDPSPFKAPFPHLHSTGFIVGPGGKVVVAVYSSSAIGRLGWQDALAVVQKIKSAKQAQTATGS